MDAKKTESSSDAPTIGASPILSDTPTLVDPPGNGSAADHTTAVGDADAATTVVGDGVTGAQVGHKVSANGIRRNCGPRILAGVQGASTRQIKQRSFCTHEARFGNLETTWEQTLTNTVGKL